VPRQFLIAHPERDDVWLRVGLICAITFACLSASVALVGILPLERAGAEWLRAAVPLSAVAALRVVNGFGHRFVLVGAAMAGFALYATRERKLAGAAVWLLAAPLVEGAAALAVGRPRPHGPGIGYPSGHVFGALVVYGFIAAVVGRRIAVRPLRYALAIAVAAFVAAMALARVALGAHWPADVLGAAVAGVAYLALGLRALGMIPRAVDRPPPL
jgi:undecaprenyl-diphosphatase